MTLNTHFRLVALYLQSALHRHGVQLLNVINLLFYVYLLEEAMYSCCLCILIASLCILIVVYVLSMYS